MNDEIRNRYRGYRSRAERPAQPPTPLARPKLSQPVNRPQPTPKSVDARTLSRELSNDFELPVDPLPPGPSRRAPKKGRAKKVALITLAVLLVGAGGSVGAYQWFKNRPGPDKNPYSLGSGAPAPAQPEQPEPAGTIRFVATGDMIAHDSVNQNARKADGSYDYLPLMAKMKPFFDKADVSFCNQSTPAGGAEFGISGYPTFNAPVEFARGIEAVGCNVINLGTNHTNDKGQPLIDATVKAWENRENILAVAGANRSASEQNQNRFFTVKGMKFAFLSYTTYSNNTNLTPHGVNMYSQELAAKQMKEARAENDFVIVSMRWGTEYSPEVNAEQDKIAQELANLGADVIIGHGPHVLEPVKRLEGRDGRETLVWYSLGNFLNTQLEIESLIGGFAVMDIDLATKKVSKIGFLPVYSHYEWTAAEKRANNLLARRSLQMLPLDEASQELFNKAQNPTTVAAQTERVKTVLNKFIEVPILKSSEY